VDLEVLRGIGDLGEDLADSVAADELGSVGREDARSRREPGGSRVDILGQEGSGEHLGHGFGLQQRHSQSLQTLPSI